MQPLPRCTSPPVEATRGIEPLCKALQASASPLGHVALREPTTFKGMQFRTPLSYRLNGTVRLSDARVRVTGTGVGDNHPVRCAFRFDHAPTADVHGDVPGAVRAVPHQVSWLDVRPGDRWP